MYNKEKSMFQISIHGENGEYLGRVFYNGKQSLYLICKTKQGLERFKRLIKWEGFKRQKIERNLLKAVGDSIEQYRIPKSNNLLGKLKGRLKKAGFYLSVFDNHYLQLSYLVQLLTSSISFTPDEKRAILYFISQADSGQIDRLIKFFFQENKEFINIKKQILRNLIRL